MWNSGELLGKQYLMKRFWIIGLIFCSINLQAQKVEVPSTIHFADMQLELSPAARKKVQTDVDALLRSEKYFLLKLEKVDAYFPLIEQVLKEEKVPEDIKYLVIQESALVGDAVSTSNAIGYWQFKVPAAEEVGLTINHAVDERMNIINATRGAARYFKNNNTFFDNWLYALLAYNTGPGGALKLANKSQYGVKRMHLEGNTHWYVLKFLAHKVAFEGAVGKNPHPKIQLFVYTQGNGKTLQEIAQEFNLEETELAPYNRWLKVKRIPDDKQYNVVVPDFDGNPDEELLAQAKPLKEEVSEVKENKPYSPSTPTAKQTPVTDTRRFPVVEDFDRRGADVKINGILGIIAKKGDNIRTLSEKSGISPSRIVTFNDLTSKQSAIIPGQPYYIRNKHNRGAARYHVVEPGETLWTISQRFGIKLKKLIRNNRMKEEEQISAGRVLWLRYIRPADFPVEYREVDTPLTKTTAVVTNTSSSPTQERSVPVQEKSNIREEIQEQDVNEESYHSWQATQEPIKGLSSDTKSPEKSGEVQQKEEAFDHAGVNFVETSPEVSTSFPDYHIVQKGETFYSIARQYHLTIPQIRQFNHLSPEDTLKVGQKIILKAPANVLPAQKNQPVAMNYIYHEVKPGETLYRVARHYEVTIKDLMDWNDKATFNVSVGERLKIAKTAIK